MKGGKGDGESARERESERGSLWVLRENKVHVRTSPSATLRKKGLVLAQLTPESYASKGIELVLAPGVVPLPGVGTTLARFPTISLNFLETSLRNNVNFQTGISTHLHPMQKAALLSEKKKKRARFRVVFPY